MLLKTSGITVSDEAELAGVKMLTMEGSTSGTLTVQAFSTSNDYGVIMPADQGTGALTNDGSGALT
jgi:hypothetical protein